MKYFLMILALLLINSIEAQDISGTDLLKRMIAFHDPNNNWSEVRASFQVTMSTPKQPDRVSDIEINIPDEFFELFVQKDSVITSYSVSKGNPQVDKRDLRSSRATGAVTLQDRKRAILMRDYYTYLYGLPMKLKDPGTLIHDVVHKRDFKGKEYLVLEVAYEKEVGKDVWYFYADPVTYELKAYQFYKTNKKGQLIQQSGEYILLSGIHEVDQIRMPAVRKWFENKNDNFLGTDTITR